MVPGCQNFGLLLPEPTKLQELTLHNFTAMCVVRYGGLPHFAPLPTNVGHERCFLGTPASLHRRLELHGLQRVSLPRIWTRRTRLRTFAQ